MKDLHGYVEETLRRHTLLNARERSDLTAVLMAAFVEAVPAVKAGQTLHEIITSVTAAHENKFNVAIPHASELDHAMHDAFLPHLASLLAPPTPAGSPTDAELLDWLSERICSDYAVTFHRESPTLTHLFLGGPNVASGTSIRDCLRAARAKSSAPNAKGVEGEVISL